MAAKLDYRWHLREVMAVRGMFSTTDLVGPLAERWIRLSTSQVNHESGQGGKHRRESNK
jgi:hypothetical protein